MNITVNGVATQAADHITVLALVAEHTGRELGADGNPTDDSRLAMAVAVDDAVVPRAQWATTTLMPGARIDLVTAVQGG